MATTAGRLEDLAAQLREISEKLEAEGALQIAPPQAKRVRKAIGEAYEKLGKVMADLDPIKHPGFVFDPSNPNVAGRIIAITLIAQNRKPLANVDRFYGSGVYALYYNGTFPAYAAISGLEHPVYVGKADPANAGSKTALEQGDKLCLRLNEHGKNISKAASTLRLEDFQYRALVVQTGWQTAAENYLIELFKPIWNSEVDICYGFGKHGDAPQTRANQRSPWDTLHPGRDWAHRDPRMKDARTTKRITDDISRHFVGCPPMRSIDQILRQFLNEMRVVS